jgi:hypothetical protein
MKFPFKSPLGEIILQKEGKWYLTQNAEKNSEITVATLHACAGAINYDKTLAKENFTPDMDEGCPHCNEAIPNTLLVTKKLINND